MTISRKFTKCLAATVPAKLLYQRSIQMREPILGSERTFTLRIVCCLVGVVYSGFMGMQAKEGYVVSELKSTSAARS